MFGSLLSLWVGLSLVPGDAAPGDETTADANPRALAVSSPTAVVAPPVVAPPVDTAVAEDPVVATRVGTPAASEPSAPPKPPILERQLQCDEEPPHLWDGFKIASEDEQHSLKFGFLGQLRATVHDAQGADPQGAMAVRLARPTLVAQLWRGRVAMRFMPEFAGANADLLDAAATVKTDNDVVGIQFGQFRPWLSRGYRTGLPVQGLPGRGPIVDRFRVDRDVGITVRGKPWDGKLEYYVGVLNGAGRNSTTLAPSPLLTARVVVSPLGPVPYTQTPYARDVGPRSDDRADGPHNDLAVAIGGSAYTVANRETLELSADDVRRTSPRRRWGASGDFVVSKRRVFGLAEGFYEHREGFANVSIPAQDAWGVYGQAGFLVWNPYLDVSMRVGLLSDFDRDIVPIEPGFNVYLFGNHAKLQVSYRCDVALEGATSGCASHAGTLQAQLLF